MLIISVILGLSLIYVFYLYIQTNKVATKAVDKCIKLSREKIFLEDIVGTLDNSSFYISDNNSEITISDLKNLCNIICPIQIFIDGHIVWDDNQNTEDWTKDDYHKFMNDYNSLFDERRIKYFSVAITLEHHSILNIKTIEESQ